jgi:hypothetical protein
VPCVPRPLGLAARATTVVAVAALRVAISAASRWLLDQAGGREWRLARVARVRYLAAFPFLRLYKKLSRTDVAANRLPSLGLAILAPPWPIHSRPMGLCHLKPSISAATGIIGYSC